MKFKIITLFPEFIASLENYSVIGRAIKNKKIDLEIINLRDFGIGSYKQVDDKPYGGGVGMLLRVDVLAQAIKSAKNKKSKVILLSASGKKFNQKLADEYSKLEEIIIVCGHYEGHDARVEDYVDEVISIGDYVLSGGEIPALVLIDSISRLKKGVLGKDESALDESFSQNLGEDKIEYPQYTRPEIFENKKVPEILLSGDHKKIAIWKRQNSKTKE